MDSETKTNPKKQYMYNPPRNYLPVRSEKTERSKMLYRTYIMRTRCNVLQVELRHVPMRTFLENSTIASNGITTATDVRRSVFQSLRANRGACYCTTVCLTTTISACFFAVMIHNLHPKVWV